MKRPAVLGIFAALLISRPVSQMSLFSITPILILNYKKLVLTDREENTQYQQKGFSVCASPVSGLKGRRAVLARVDLCSCGSRPLTFLLS